MNQGTFASWGFAYALSGICSEHVDAKDKEHNAA